MQILNEDTAWWALNRLHELNALQVLHPKLRIEPGQQVLFKKILEVIPQIEIYYPEKVKKWLIFLMVLLQSFTVEELAQWSFQMKFRNKESKLLKQGVFEAIEVLKELQTKEKITNSQLYDMLVKLAPESLTYIFAKTSHGGVRTKINYYLANLKDVTLEINGNQLVDMGFKPSPDFSFVLDSVLKSKLDGSVRNKDDEMILAKKLLSKIAVGEKLNGAN